MAVAYMINPRWADTIKTTSKDINYLRKRLIWRFTGTSEELSIYQTTKNGQKYLGKLVFLRTFNDPVCWWNDKNGKNHLVSSESGKLRRV